MEKKNLSINCIIAIDPGASNGGICVFRPKETPKCVRMPKDLRDLRDFIAYYKGFTNPIVFVEKLNVRVDDAEENRGKLFRIQKMLANFEQIKAVLTLLDVPYCLVHPMKWQSRLNLRKVGRYEEKSERKKRYKEVAQDLYKGVKVTLWNADALLIMHFGRVVLSNDLNWLLENIPHNTHNKLF